MHKLAELDIITILFAFQTGFCCDAVMWRIDQGRMDDIIYPFLIGVASLCVLLHHTFRRTSLS